MNMKFEKFESLLSQHECHHVLVLRQNISFGTKFSLIKTVRLDVLDKQIV